MPSSQKWPQFKTRRYQRFRLALLATGPPCYWGCGRPATTADHVPPLAEVGYWHWQMVPACGTCNFGRKGRNPSAPTTGGLPSRDW